jgi:hypothetical protein
MKIHPSVDIAPSMVTAPQRPYQSVYCFLASDPSVGFGSGM